MFVYPGLLIVLVICEVIFGEIQINIDVKDVGVPLKHFWRSTGLCPRDPKQDIHRFLLSEDEKVNLALIGALPNRAISQVRIHWLINLITLSFSNNTLQYNFCRLDEFLDWLHGQKLYAGFEIMGIPTFADKKVEKLFYTFHKHPNTIYQFWYDLVLNIARRYIGKFGFKYVQKWRFETWNEPDLKSYNVLNFKLPDYLAYVRACGAALEDALGPDHKTTPKRLKLGGPAGLFKNPEKHPLCWGMLRACNERTQAACPLGFISFHKKGDGTAGQVSNGSLTLLDLLRVRFPNIRRLPIANDEADILTNWSKGEDWRGDARYAGMIVKVIADFYKKVGPKVPIEVLSNDNAFLNYHPYYFTQRTLLTRFQMNITRPPHIQFIKKPAYSVMGMLSLLGDEYLKQNLSSEDPAIEIFASKSIRTTSLLITYVNDTQEASQSSKAIKIVFENLTSDSKYVIYLLDNAVETNPFSLWKNAGAPAFPSKSLRQAMRNAQEPLRIRGPSCTNSILEVKMRLTLPAVVLVHVCSNDTEAPGRVTHLRAYNVTRDEVLLTWRDAKVRSKCILTYEVEFRPEAATADFRRVNARDTIFLSYHHVGVGGPTREATRGLYRVRAVNYWNIPGKYSKLLRYPSN